jgi:hypothetical protein
LFDDKPVGLVTSVVHEDVVLTGVPSVETLGHEVAMINFSTGEIIKNISPALNDGGMRVGEDIV